MKLRLRLARVLLGVALSAAAVACAGAARPAVGGPARAPEAATALARDAGGAAEAPSEARPVGAARLVPLAPRDVVWSPRSDVVVARERTTCGPGADPGCHETAALVAREPVARTPRASRADAAVFGFRADGEWLVIGSPAGGLEEWSTRSGAVRPSAFGPLASGARALCLAPDDRRALVGFEGSLALRSVSSEEEQDVPVSPVEDASDCAFAPDGARVAIAYPTQGVVVLDVHDPAARARVVASLPFAGASHLSWSADGRALGFAGPETVPFPDRSAKRLAVRWLPADGSLLVTTAESPSALVRGLVVAHDGCVWQRGAAGAPLRTVGAPASSGSCARDITTDVARSPDGRFVAATTGRYGALGLEIAKTDGW